MRLTLVLPPPWDVTQPYLGLPILSSFLKSYGHEIILRDLNIETYDFMLSPAWLKQINGRIGIRLRDIQNGSFAGPDELRSLKRSRSLAPILIGQSASIKEVLRSPVRFYDSEAYFKSIRLFHRICDMISSAFYPTFLSPVSFQMKYNTSVLADIMAAVEDEAENLFLPVLEEVLVPSLLKDKPDVVGISVVYSDQVIPALTIAHCIKRADSHAKLIVGGDIFSRVLRTSRGNLKPLFNLVDAFVLDEGEQPLASICECLQMRQPFDSVPFVVTAANYGKDLVAKRNVAVSFSGLPPDFAGLPLKLYFSPEPIFSIRMAKGCKWGQCAFCTESFKKEYIEKKMDSVLGGMDELVHTFKARLITFTDSHIDADRLRDLANGLLKREYRIFWTCRTRLDERLDESLCKLLAASGCQKLYFGLESANQRLLDRMHKGIKLSSVGDILEACGKSGIATHLFCFAGFPSESPHEAINTANFIVTHRNNISSFNFGYFHFRIMSRMFSNPSKYGLSPMLDELSDGDVDYLPYETDDGLSMEEAGKLSYILLNKVYEKICHDNKDFQIYRSSSYVNRRTIPAWDGHNLAYLAHDNFNTFTTHAGPETEELKESTLLTGTPFVEVEDRPDGGTLIFHPATAKLLVISKDGMQLLKSCDGKKSVSGLMDSVRQEPAAIENSLNFISTMLRERLIKSVGQS